MRFVPGRENLVKFHPGNAAQPVEEIEHCTDDTDGKRDHAVGVLEIHQFPYLFIGRHLVHEDIDSKEVVSHGGDDEREEEEDCRYSEKVFEIVLSVERQQGCINSGAVHDLFVADHFLEQRSFAEQGHEDEDTEQERDDAVLDGEPLGREFEESDDASDQNTNDTEDSDDIRLFVLDPGIDEEEDGESESDDECVGSHLILCRSKSEREDDTVESDDIAEQLILGKEEDGHDKIQDKTQDGIALLS